MITPEFEKLFQPYSQKVDFQGVLKWLTKEAKNRDISEPIMNIALAQTFLEMGKGKVFPRDGCPCGCEFKNPHSALVHYIRARMINLHRKATTIQARLLEGQLRESIKVYVRYHMKSRRFFRHLITWKKSWIIRGIKWIF